VIELIKAGIEAATKIIPVSDILKQRRADRVADVGLRLFDLYHDTIQVSQNGFEIIRRVADVVHGNKEYYRAKQFYDERKPNAHARRADDLKVALIAQYYALHSLLITYESLANVAEIAESSSDQTYFFPLYKLLTSKAALMRGLEEIDLSSDEPLGSAGLWLSYELGAAEPDQSSNTAAKNAALSLLMGRFHELEVPEFEILMALFERKVRITTIPWDETVNKLAEYYIESGLAKKRLDDLVEAASKFRAAFQKSFKIEDVLLAFEKRLTSQAKQGAGP
jgi:hypothetical protein